MTTRLGANTPDTAKKRRRSVKWWNKLLWVSARDDVARRALELKVAQHPSLQTNLLALKRRLTTRRGYCVRRVGADEWRLEPMAGLESS